MIVIIIFYRKLEYIEKLFRKHEACSFIKKDRDMYIELMSKYDLKARGCETKEEYIEKACSGVTDLRNVIEYIYLTIACYMADMYFKDEFDSKYIPDNHKIHELPWKFVFTCNDEYEQGFPHTRKDIIFLPIDNIFSKSLVKLLIHEKVHIYQRYNINKIDELLKLNGFTKYKTRDNYPLIRANPDLNNWIYKGPDGYAMYYEYNSIEPTNIEDVTRHGSAEHPYELIAYEIENDYEDKGFFFSRIR